MNTHYDHKYLQVRLYGFNNAVLFAYEGSEKLCLK